MMASKRMMLGLAGIGCAAVAMLAARSRNDLPPVEQLTGSSLRQASFTLDCRVASQPISPLIYGVGGTEPPWETGTTARRWGGNPTTRYNWKLNTYNITKDW